MSIDMLILRRFNRFMLVSLALLSFSANTSAVVLDFNELDPDTALLNVGNLYQNSGFEISTPGSSSFSAFFSHGTLAGSPPNTGSPALWEGTGQGNIFLSEVDDNPFSIQSIDLIELNPHNDLPGSVGRSVEFRGFFSEGGGFIDETFTLDGIFGAETFFFDSLWTGLRQVRWSQSLTSHQFDNIVLNEPVSAVPVPAAFWLFGTALIGLVGFSKRRKAA